jgi:hypothetical protein
MDALDMRGELGGAIALSGGYAHAPLRVAAPGGAPSLSVVSHEAFAAIGVAVMLDRLRLHLELDSPLRLAGESGTVGAARFEAPSVDLGDHPDTLSDVRLGFEARLVGEAASAFRFGLGAELVVPSGNREDYLTDGTYRGMSRALFAGDLGRFTWAGQLGVHFRARNDDVPESPRGTELLFGAAAGLRVAAARRTSVVLGPELYGETAFRAFFGATSTGLEALATGRLEHALEGGPELRLKLGAGGGLVPHFGAPDARVVVSLELLDYGPEPTNAKGGSRRPP